MQQTWNKLAETLAERLCWEVAHRDDSRVARRLYHKQVVDGVYRLDEGAVLDDFFHFLDTIGVMALLSDVHGTVIRREMVPFVQYVLLYSLKTLFGIESSNALPALLLSDEALPAGKFEPQALLCTDLTVEPVQILEWFVLRCRLEVTWQEARGHLGMAT